MEGAIAADLGDGRVQAVVLKQVEKMKMGMHHMQLHSEILDSPGPVFEVADQGQGSQPSVSLFSVIPQGQSLILHGSWSALLLR
jgi:hypothetical protein